MDAAFRSRRFRSAWVLGAVVVAVLFLLPTGIASFGAARSPAPSPGTASGSRGNDAANPTGAPVALGPIHPSRIPAAPAIGASVNPNAYYSAEPAPIGIGDFGIGANATPYTYHTSAFYGDLTFHKLTVYNSVIASSSLTVQLNIVLTFHRGGANYAYWIQDVAFLDSSSNYLWFENNIWNFSSSGAGLSSSSVSGNGSIYSSEVYIAGASSSLPGNDITISTPFQIGLECWATVVNSRPEVVFQYRDGSGWVTYDNPIFSFAKGATSVNFTVDGSGYNGYGLFNDAELILGGPGGGENTTATGAAANMSLAYYNGRNFQAVPNAYDFGSDTAEAINGLTTALGTIPANGSLSDSLGHGSGSLKQLYTSSSVATVSVQTRATVGSLAINGTTPIPYQSSPINLTIAPGSYNFSLSVLGTYVGSRLATVSAGSVAVLYINNGSTFPITFQESGLPTGTAWGISFGPSKLATQGTSIALSAPNGTYAWHAAGTPGYRASPIAGTLTVAGAGQTVPLSYRAFEFGVDVVETGLPAGTSWSATVNGSTASATGAIIPFLDANGTYAFAIGSVAGYFANVTSGLVTVAGSNATLSIKFQANPSAKSQQIARSIEVVALGSVGASALSAVRLSNGSFELVLFNAKTNRTKVVTVVAGGGTIPTDGIAAAGGAFFVEIAHAPGSALTFERVNVSGTSSIVSLPIGAALPWTFAHGSTTDLFAATGGDLVAIDPSTRAVIANYSTVLPSTLWVDAVLLDGQKLYLAGSLEASNGSSSAYLGSIYLATDSLRNISRAHYGPVGVSEAFDALASASGFVFAAGGIEQAGSGTNASLQPLFYRYYPWNNAYTNLTSELPAGHEVIVALDPWLGGLLLSAETFSGSGTSLLGAGGLFAVGSGGAKLLNDTAFLPGGFVPNGDGVVSASGGYVFLGGSNPSAGRAEVVALSP